MTCCRFPRKPDWVINEVVRLKAYMPNASGYTIAHTFNRIHQNKNNMTVGKSFVYEIFKKQQQAILLKQQSVKRRKPAHYPNNQLWQLDLTQIQTNNKNNALTLGVIDAGSRACLSLQTLPNKTSITLLKMLLDTVEKYGKPNTIRTDNEPVFISYVFRLGLLILNIQHQRTQICSPWQNGHIERLFGTLKRYTRQITIPEQRAQFALNQFRLWYNHVRPHQNINGQTPAEAWSNKQVNRHGTNMYFNLWEGVLTGYYLPPN